MDVVSGCHYKACIMVSGPLIQHQALKFATHLKIDSFHASNGWLQSFLKCKNIVLGSVNGDSVELDMTTAKQDKGLFYVASNYFFLCVCVCIYIYIKLYIYMYIYI